MALFPDKIAKMVPKSVKIGPYTWKISPAYFEDQNQWGECDQDQLHIKVYPDSASEVVQETLVHEQLHAMWFCAGLPTSYEEKVVRSLSPYLLMWLRDNLGMLMFLLQEHESQEPQLVSTGASV